MEQKRMQKNSKGITLIALVITIIVLLILAGVTIATLTGENGILNQANQAKIKSDIAEVKEQAQLDIANWTAERLRNGQDTNLDDATVKSIIETANNDKTNKYYSKLTTTSIITKQGNEILFSEFYKKEGTEGVDYSQLNVGDYISNYPVQYDNVGTWVDSSNGTIKGNIPQDKYKGWRILSIEGEGDNAYVKLVSAGVPLNYYHYDTSATSVENLTTKFFNTSIESSITRYKFYKCGFKTASGTEITDINSLKGLFTNEFTATYASGESATYTDSTLGSTFTNADVVGNPKVQAMTKADLDKVWGSSISYRNEC